MAHREQIHFISGARDILFPVIPNSNIFEVGSYDVNGTIRNIFNSCETYVGADLVAGPGVDIVGSGHEIDLENDKFGLTLSCECFEHNPFWVETFQNMYRMTQPDGYVVVTSASRGRIEHGTARTTMSDSPGTSAVGINYYRNLNEIDFASKLPLTEMFSDYKFWYIKASCDLYFVGRKRGNVNTFDIAHRFTKLINEVNSLSGRHRGLLRQFLFETYRLPLNISSFILNDERFQDFAVVYDRLFTPFKSSRQP